MANLERPKELNILGNNNFHFEIFELPVVSLFAQEFSVPGTSLGRAQFPNPNVDFNHPGEKMVFEDLVITFLVDEYMQNYMEIFNWMAFLGFPKTSRQFKFLKEDKTPYKEKSDIILTATTNKFNAHHEIHFVDCFPTDLSPIDFTNAEDTVSPVQATVTFDYSYYYFRNIVEDEENPFDFF